MGGVKLTSSTNFRAGSEATNRGAGESNLS